jgi:hypothetical protein
MIKSRKMREVGYVTFTRQARSVYRFSVGKPEGKRPLGRPRREGNIRKDLTEIGWGGFIWLRIGTSGGLS